VTHARDEEVLETPLAAEAAPAKRDRLVSLDAFRGFVIASMLLVNTTWNEDAWGGGFGRSLALQLGHVPWNSGVQGATFTDLVFPWFLFIVGAAAPLSMRSGRGRDRPRWKRLAIALRRGAVIYLLGVLLTHAGSWLERPAEWTDALSWNILQIIGAAYVATVAITMLPRWAWWASLGGILAVKMAVMLAIDAEWVRSVMAGAGLEPRGATEATGHGTFTHFDDVKRFLNREHVDPSAGAWAAFDRRGIGWLGAAQQWLPAAAIAVGGALTVDWISRERLEAWRRIAAPIAIGALACLLAAVQGWGYRPGGGGLLGPLTIPASKWLFSPAYCLLSIGSGAVLLTLFFAVIDAGGARWAAVPWRVFGVNAIAVYVGAELCYKLAFSRWLLPVPGGEGGASSLPGAINAWAAWWLPEGELASWGAIGGAEWAGGRLDWLAISGLAFSVMWLAGWWAVCRWLDRRKIYIRV